MPDEIRFQQSGPKLTPADLITCEKELGVKLPKAYRALLLEHNGGRPKPAAFLLRNGMTPVIDRLLSVGAAEPGDDLVRVTRQLRQEAGIPDRYLPFARTEGDCLVLLDTQGRAAGKLYFWSDRECGFRLRDPDYDNVESLYYGIDELTAKLGPSDLKRRRDPDGMYFRVAHAVQSPSNGRRMLRRVVTDGHDINHVPPGMSHPIFHALDLGEYDPALALLELGTRSDHKDGRRSVVDRLREALGENEGHVRLTPPNNPLHKLALRNLETIRACLALTARGGKRSQVAG